jgi:argininosuccinate synthase
MSFSEILEKINSTPIQKGQKVAVAFSGGLGSSLAIPLLKHIYEAKEIIPITIDVDAKWAYLVYHGLWYSPLKQALDAFILQSQQMVCGKIKAKLYKGNIEITNRESKHSLFAPEVRSIKSASFEQRWCAHAAKIRGLPCEILANRQQNILNGVVS